MEWQAEGTVLARRPHGETAVILDVLTDLHGRHSGLVPGGASQRRAAMLQPGTRLDLRWRARRDDQLGTFSVEPVRLRSGLMADPLALAGLNAVCSLLVFALPERDPHPLLVADTERLLDLMETGADWGGDYLKWEIRLLDEMGFGLDLSACAVTGAREGLAYVSPKSGRAVSREGAGEWADRLLPLPGILGGAGDNRGQGLAEGLAITGHFLNARIAGELVGRPVPAARQRLVDRLARGRPGNGY
ncbi:DNA repair protein RecO [Paracoccus benzoatiresistens]|uniref:DNA repair protein RecO n=1 Tax=Paracoccus benzoatiresistens TaxID=2997341 RepID=A0ABT4J7A3_9RHOB|nr:DNA repair protein RecO [Paracoccus sp. EF6]MCZ0962784.1 DNA repair protein RecO [Paracoccus sp. EF6]